MITRAATQAWRRIARRQQPVPALGKQSAGTGAVEVRDSTAPTHELHSMGLDDFGAFKTGPLNVHEGTPAASQRRETTATPHAREGFHRGAAAVPGGVDPAASRLGEAGHHEEPASPGPGSIRQQDGDLAALSGPASRGATSAVTSAGARPAVDHSPTAADLVEIPPSLASGPVAVGEERSLWRVPIFLVLYAAFWWGIGASLASCASSDALRTWAQCVRAGNAPDWCELVARDIHGEEVPK